MRILMFHSQRDKPAVEPIARHLENDGHSVWRDDWLQLRQGDNVIDKIGRGVKDADALILVASENSSRSPQTQLEFSAIAFQQVSIREQRVILVRIDQSELPGYLGARVYIDMADDFESGLDALRTALHHIAESRGEVGTGATPRQNGRAAHVPRLRDELRRGRLTLVCGAGVSVEAGIPLWGELLVRLLRRMIDRIAATQNVEVILDEEAAAEFDRRYDSSSLILGKYLKTNLGKEFLRELRDELYRSPPERSALLECIVGVARPPRDGKSLDSIITFNFDSLIEENLRSHRIPARPIFSEAITHHPNEIPVYHVHGFLPREGEIPETSNIVFSEDAYHSQFLDPFSWSNLIQLTKLTQNTCLLVGISLTDPNLRRLLDVAWRKRPDKTPSHYILKKIPRLSKGDGLDTVSKLLEEQDANALGLNVIWVDDFPEIPAILDEISTVA